MKTVHAILSTHLDPIWLWPWASGLDAAIASCRSACERMDENPDAVFTLGEAWLYEQIETVEPALFERIRKHVDRGTWSLVGG